MSEIPPTPLRAPVAKFFAWTFLFTWALQWPGVVARWGWLPGDPNAYLPFAMLGVFGPMVAATILTARERGKAGVRALFRRLGAWRVQPFWYVTALFLPGACLSGILWSFRAFGSPVAWHFLSGLPQIVIAFVISVAEETGWRGYALPRLEERHGPIAANVLLGGVWCIWHVPMFLAMDVPMSLFPVMLVFFVGGSFFFAWILRGSGGSLLLVVLAHVGGHLNNSHAALPRDAFPLVIHTFVYACLGAWSAKALSKRRESRSEPDVGFWRISRKI